MASKTIKEQVTDLEATRAELVKQMETVAEKSIEGDRTTNTAEAAEFDDAEAQIKTIDADIARLKRLEAVQAKSATAVTGKTDADQVAGQQRHEGVGIRNTEKLEPGIGFARAARCKALSHIHHQPPEQIAKQIYPSDERLHNALVGKATVSAATTTEAVWAGNLILDSGASFGDFVEYLRPRTLLGQISGKLRVLPFDMPVLIQGTGGTAKWSKEGTAKTMTEWTYTRTKMAPLKVAAIAAATKESLMRASIAADTLLRDELANAVGATIDTTFIDPDAAAVTDESPAGILNGVSALTLSGGTTVADIRCDIAAFMTAMSDNNLSLANTFWVMPERTAIALSLVSNEVGAQAFPGITPQGGTFAGLPVFTSNYANTTTDGSVVALVKGDEIFLADEGGVQVSMSDQASLVMDTAPNHNSTTPTATSVVSMWQTNSVAFLVERFINWQRRRTASVAWARVGWSACSTT